MRGIARANGGRAVQILTAALASAVVAPLFFVIFAAHVGEPTLAGAAVGAAVAFAVVAGCAWVGGRYGFVLLWALILAGWVLIVLNTITGARQHFSLVMTRLPDGFLAWSSLAVPPAIGTALAVRRIGSHARLTVAAGAAAWLALAAANSFLAQYAPDVGCSPRQNRVLATWIGVPSLAAPFVVSGWFIWRLRGIGQAIRDGAVVTRPGS
jgi:hypothetical protein